MEPHCRTVALFTLLSRFSRKKNGLPTKDLPFSEPFSKTFSMKVIFCVRDGSVTPREKGSAKRTQVMLLGGWSTEDVV
jgi:hypothetical protein